MIKSKLFAIAGLFAVSLVTSALAQRVIVAGEPLTPDGTYCNIYAPNSTTLNAGITFPTTTCGLFTRSLMAYASNSSILSSLLSVGLNPSGNNASNSPVITTYAGVNLAFNLSASTVVKAAAGRFYSVSVITAGSTVGAVHDTNATGSAAVANQVAAIPNTVGIYTYNFPMSTGITFIPGTGQVVVINYN